MSVFLGQQLRLYESQQHEWRMEMPYCVQGKIIGYRLMNTEGVRRFFVGAEIKPDGNKNIIPLPLDILSFSRERGMTIVVTNGEKMYELNCKQLHWGSPYFIRDIAFAHVNLLESGAKEILSVQKKVEVENSGERF